MSKFWDEKVPEIEAYEFQGVFTPAMFSPFKSNTGLISSLVGFFLFCEDFALKTIFML